MITFPPIYQTFPHWLSSFPPGSVMLFITVELITSPKCRVCPQLRPFSVCRQPGACLSAAEPCFTVPSPSLAQAKAEVPLLIEQGSSASFNHLRCRVVNPPLCPFPANRVRVSHLPMNYVHNSSPERAGLAAFQDAHLLHHFKLQP